MKRNAVVAFAAAWMVCVAAIAGCANSPKAYRIRIYRPLAVGQRYQLRISGTWQDADIQTPGKNGQGVEIEETQSAVSASGIAEVLAVDSLGRPTRLAWTLDKCVKTVHGKQTVLVPPGQTVIVQTGAKLLPKVTAKDPTCKLSQEAVTQIGILAPVVKGPTKMIDDDVIGTRRPKKIGEAWPVNAKKLAEAYTEVGQAVAAKDISGRSTLVGLTKVQGVQCLDIKAEETIRHLPPIHTLHLPHSDLWQDNRSIDSDQRYAVPVAFSPSPLVRVQDARTTVTFQYKGNMKNGSIDPNKKFRSVFCLNEQMSPVPK